MRALYRFSKRSESPDPDSGSIGSHKIDYRALTRARTGAAPTAFPPWSTGERSSTMQSGMTPQTKLRAARISAHLCIAFLTVIAVLAGAIGDWLLVSAMALATVAPFRYLRDNKRRLNG